MKKLVNEKRDEMKNLEPKELIDRILSYPDQDSLNRDSGMRKREFPVGKVAESVRDRGYEMSDNQRFALIHDFAAITTPTIKPKERISEAAAALDKEQIAKDGTKTTYQADFTLETMPTGDIVQIGQRTTMEVEGRQEPVNIIIGSVDPKFVDKFQITEDVQARGTFTDYSNGKFKNVSYEIEVDVEPIVRAHAQEQAQDAAQDAAKENPLALTEADLDFANELAQQGGLEQ